MPAKKIRQWQLKETAGHCFLSESSVRQSDPIAKCGSSLCWQIFYVATSALFSDVPVLLLRFEPTFHSFPSDILSLTSNGNIKIQRRVKTRRVRSVVIYFFKNVFKSSTERAFQQQNSLFKHQSLLGGHRFRRLVSHNRKLHLFPLTWICEVFPAISIYSRRQFNWIKTGTKAIFRPSLSLLVRVRVAGHRTVTKALHFWFGFCFLFCFSHSFILFRIFPIRSKRLTRSSFEKDTLVLSRVQHM